jgi:hypothetical protein
MTSCLLLASRFLLLDKSVMAIWQLRTLPQDMIQFVIVHWPTEPVSVKIILMQFHLG